MALDIRLYSAHYQVELESDTDYGVRGGSLGLASRQRIFASPWKRGYQPLVGLNDENRVMELMVRIKGSSLDNWIIAHDNIQQLLRDAELWHESEGLSGARAIFAAQLSGMTNVTEWDVISGDLQAGEVFRTSMYRDTTAPILANVPLTLICKPYGRPQAHTRSVSATIDNGDDKVILTAPSGQVATPLKLTLQSAAGDPFIRAIGGRKTKGTVSNFIWVMECETGAFTGYTVTDVETSNLFALSNVADAAMHGGSKLRMTTDGAGTAALAPVVRWTINDNLSDFYGTYRVLIKYADLGGNAVTLGLTYGGTLGRDIANAQTTLSNQGTGERIADLGRMVIPHRAGPSNVALASFLFEVRVTLVDNDSAGPYDFDCIYLIPIDEESFDLEASATLSAQDQLILDGLAEVSLPYIVDSTGDLQPERVTFNAPSGQRNTGSLSVEPGVDNLWCILMLQIVTSGTGAYQVDLTDDFTATFEYYPYFHFFR